MNSKTRLILLLIYSCCYVIGMAQQEEIPLAEIEFKRGGMAAITIDDCYQLTNNQNWVSGAIWYPAPINLAEDFEMEVALFFGCNDNGADGIVFIFSPKLKVGYAGEGMGFSGLNPSLGIEFDTYQNFHLDDPAKDHIAIMENGNINHRFNSVKPVTINSNLEDCKKHKVKVIWKAAAMELQVYLDDFKIIDLHKNIVKDLFKGNPAVYWGFTAATGGQRNQHKVCFEKLVFEELPKAPAFTTTEMTKMLKGDITALNNVLFESGSAILKKEAAVELAKLLTLLRENPAYHIGIYGHTDSVGDTQKNESLSLKRATTIVDFLSSKGISANRLSAKGMGAAYPIASNDKAAGRLKNRRIEIYLYKPIP